MLARCRTSGCETLPNFSASAMTPCVVGSTTVRCPPIRTNSGRKAIDGAELAQFARDNAAGAPKDPLGIGSSARNRFVGLVTDVVDRQSDGAGRNAVRPFHCRVTDEHPGGARTRPEPGSVAVAVVKATTVIVETPKGHHDQLDERRTGRRVVDVADRGLRFRVEPLIVGADSLHHRADEGGHLVVFAAASLKSSFTAIGEQFKTDNPGTSVEFSFAGSSDLVTQLTQGARPMSSPPPTPATWTRRRRPDCSTAPRSNFASNTLTIVVAPGTRRTSRHFRT